MDVATMITELGDHGFSDESTNTKVRAIQQAVWDIESREAWPFLEKSVDLTFDGVNDSPTNSNLNIRSVRRLTGSDGTRIRYLRVEELEDSIGANYTLQATAGNNPVYYWLEGTTINVWPIPLASTTIRMRYLQFSSDLTSGSLETAFLIPKQYHRVIVRGALHYLYDMEDDDMAGRYQSKYEKELSDMRAAVYQRQLDRPNVIRMTDVDDYDPYAHLYY